MLKDPHNHLVHDEIWNLETIAAHEQLTIQYDFQFATSAPSGVYTLTTELDGRKAKPMSMLNGTVLVHATEQPLALSGIPNIRITHRAVQAEPADIKMEATSTPPLMLTAAAAASDPGDWSRPLMYASFFILFLLSIYSAARALTRKNLPEHIIVGQ
jgi:hypothetical protein